MTGQRARRLEKLGVVWSIADERFQENLEAAKAYYEDHWTLCAPRSAVALDRPVGQWLSNLRRAGALEGSPGLGDRAHVDRRGLEPGVAGGVAAALRRAARAVAEKRATPRFCPGSRSTRWTSGSGWPGSVKPEVWQALHDGQRERLERFGITPLAPEPEAPAKPSTTPLGAVPRGHVERLEDGAEVKLGVFLSNSKSRRGKLTTDKLAALAALGLDWAAS
ncbi:helicase associated domain-containing protein [Streptomyces canus]|uniref:helicase associated domain-containing protein n=1 Tax=Streptomyces canus TaxID=58343 RepID=UPI003AF302FB